MLRSKPSQPLYSLPSFSPYTTIKVDRNLKQSQDNSLLKKQHPGLAAIRLASLQHCTNITDLKGQYHAIFSITSVDSSQDIINKIPLKDY